MRDAANKGLCVGTNGSLRSGESWAGRLAAEEWPRDGCLTGRVYAEAVRRVRRRFRVKLNVVDGNTLLDCAI